MIKYPLNIGRFSFWYVPAGVLWKTKGYMLFDNKHGHVYKDVSLLKIIKQLIIEYKHDKHLRY